MNHYIEVAGGGERRITRDEVVEAETRMMIQELSSAETIYGSVYPNWRTENGNDLQTENAAYNAGHRLCLSYLSPSGGQSKAIQRGNDAKIIYNVMMS